MAFRTKTNATDHFGIVALSGTPAAIALKPGDSKISPGVVAEAEDEVGDVIATDLNGVREKLSNPFTVVKTLALATMVVMGKLGTTKALLNGFSITTSKGKAPEGTVDGERMNADATQGATIVLPAISISPLHKAQILAGAFTFTGTGCKLNECSLKGSCGTSLGEVAGEIVSHDVQRGILAVTASVVASGASDPEFTAGEGWECVDGPQKTEPEGGHDMWTVTYRKPLVTTPAA